MTTLHTAKPAQKNKTKINVLLDIGLLLVFLILFEVHATGIALHEWLGIAIGIAITTHIVLHWDWVVTVTKRFFQTTNGQARLNYILNVALFIAFTAVVFSGLMISESILPMLGIEASHASFWKWLHHTAPNITLLLTALHVALHRNWIINAFKRYIFVSGQKEQRQPAAPLATETEVK